MRFFNQCFLVTALLALLTSSVLAQQTPQPQTQPVQPQARPVQPSTQPVLPDRIRAPAFLVPDVGRNLNLTPQQLNQLTQLNEQLRTPFQTQFNQLNQLAEQQRTARLQELLTGFDTDFARSAGDIISRKQLARLQQLELQRRGLNAFGESTVQERLNLTQGQRESLRQLNERISQDMQRITRLAQTNQEAALTQLDALRQQTLIQTNAVLTEPQRRLWREMIGDPFNFPPDFVRQGP
jgi:hypothetical protein